MSRVRTLVQNVQMMTRIGLRGHTIRGLDKRGSSQRKQRARKLRRGFLWTKRPGYTRHIQGTEGYPFV